MDFHNADGEGFRDGGKFLFADARGWFDGLPGRTIVPRRDNHEESGVFDFTINAG
jgi:hypothetical protein